MVFYYEYKSTDDGEIYGGFLQANTYTEAMSILEDYTGPDLAGMRVLQAYDNAVMCLPVSEARTVKDIYDESI